MLDLYSFVCVLVAEVLNSIQCDGLVVPCVLEHYVLLR